MVLGASLGLTKSGVRWVNAPTVSPPIEKPPQIIGDLEGILKSGNDKEAINSVLKHKIDTAGRKDLEALMTWVDKIKAKNKRLSEEQMSYLDAIQTQVEEKLTVRPIPPVKLAILTSAGTNADATILAIQWINITDSERRNEDLRHKISLGTTTHTKRLADEMKLLSDLNNDTDIDSTLRNVVNEDVLKRAISRVTSGGEEAKLKEVYQRITGKEATTFTPQEVKEFQTKLRTSLLMIQKITGGNAGLYGLLMGNLDAYMARAPSWAKIQLAPMTQQELDNLTPSTRNLIAAGVWAGLFILTGGIVAVDYRQNELDANSILVRLDRSLPRRVVDYIRDIFTGRRWSLTVGQDLKMDVTEFRDKITQFAVDISQGNPQSNEWKEYYKAATDIAWKLKMNGNNEAIQKAAISAYIIDLASGNHMLWSDRTARLSPFFIGANYDAIDQVTLATNYSDFNRAEAQFTTRKLSEAELSLAWISIERLDNWKFNHNIPQSVEFSWDDRALQVIRSSTLDLSNADKVYDLHFSDRGDGKYTLTATIRVPQPNLSSPAPIMPIADTNRIQDINTVRNARSWQRNNAMMAWTIGASEMSETNSNTQLSTLLYNAVGHSNPKLFTPLFTAIRSRDPDRVDQAITQIDTAWYKTLAKMLKADESNYEIWTTYMYGSKESRMNDNPTQEWANKTRIIAVTKAEDKLAKASGITSKTEESQFSVENKWAKHTPIQVSQVFPGQEMTVSVFATPLGGLHRIDAFDGSLAMSQKYVEISDQGYKNQIIDATSKDSGIGGIQEQVDRLNTFLKLNTKWSILIQEYVAFLKTGDIASFQWITWLQLQTGKNTRIFEWRAMIAGNVCMNRLHGVVYPAFEIVPTQPWTTQTIRQPISPAGHMDATAQLNLVTLVTTEAAGGISPIPLILRNAWWNRWSNDGTTRWRGGDTIPEPPAPQV